MSILLTSLRRGFHVSHPAYVFHEHGLDIGAVTLSHDDIGNISGPCDLYASVPPLFVGYRADIHLRGPTVHLAAHPP